MQIPTLAQFSEAEGVGDIAVVEAFLQSVLTRQTDDPSCRLAAFRYLALAGRFADLVKLITMDPGLLKVEGTLTWGITAAIASGWAELIDRFDLFSLTLAAPEQFIRPVGNVLIRGAYILAHEGHVSAPMRQYVNYLTENVPISVAHAYDPVLLRLHSNLFGSTATRQAIKTLDDGHPAWVWASLARSDSALIDTAADALTGARKDDCFPDPTVVAYTGTGGFREGLGAMDSGEAAGKGMALPPLTPDTVLQGMRWLYETACRLKPEVLAPFERSLDAVIDDDPSPVLVISTGRAGTKSITQLLLSSEEYAPFHHFNFVQEPGNLNRLFHGMLHRNLTDAFVKEALETLIRDRMMEFLWCTRNGRRPVIVNHLEMALTPLYLAIFPNLRIVHIRRDPARTLMSHAYKQQYRYQQIRPVYGMEDSQSGEFRYARPKELSLEENVVWFQVATELAAKAGGALIRQGNYHDINMDSVFSGERSGLAAFHDAFPDPSFTPDSLKTHFSVRINEKSHYQIPDIFNSVDRAQGLYDRYRGQILETGWLH